MNLRSHAGRWAHPNHRATRGDVRVEEGELLDCLVTEDREHFFTKAGFYDGWGMAVSSGSPGEAMELVEAVARQRRVSTRRAEEGRGDTPKTALCARVMQGPGTDHT